MLVALMARSIWKGSISFGLVTIPVELQSAVRDQRPRFRLLHAEDRSPIKYERVCRREGQPVSWAEIVKGYEYAKGKFVVLTKEDFATAALEKTKTIDIVDFVKREEVDDRYFETSYYLLPGTGGTRAYALLREAIRKSGRMGIGKIILREDQHLAALDTIDDALVLTMMRYADEVVDVSKLTLPPAKDVRPKELEMALSLIEGLSDEWSPGKYKDDYRANLMRVIDAKMKGRKLTLEKESQPQDADVIDLMERLRSSIESRRGAERKKAPAKPARRKAAASRRGRKKARGRRVA
jgi:DNA end-binding protein Ku